MLYTVYMSNKQENKGNIMSLENNVYRIFDTHTGQQVGKDYSYSQRNRARNRADKLSLEYGSYRYIAKMIIH